MAFRTRFRSFLGLDVSRSHINYDFKFYNQTDEPGVFRTYGLILSCPIAFLVFVIILRFDFSFSWPEIA